MTPRLPGLALFNISAQGLFEHGLDSAAIGARRAGIVDQVDATRIVIRATEDLEAGKSGVEEALSSVRMVPRKVG